MDDGIGMYKGYYLEQLRHNGIEGLQKDRTRVVFFSLLRVYPQSSTCMLHQKRRFHFSSLLGTDSPHKTLAMSGESIL